MFHGLAVNAPLNGALLLCKQQYNEIANVVCVSCKNQHDAGSDNQAKFQNVSNFVHITPHLLASTLTV